MPCVSDGLGIGPNASPIRLPGPCALLLPGRDDATSSRVMHAEAAATVAACVRECRVCAQCVCVPSLFDRGAGIHWTLKAPRATAGLRIDMLRHIKWAAESRGSQARRCLEAAHASRGRGKKSLPCNAKAKGPSEKEKEEEGGKLHIWIRGAVIWCRAFWVV